MIIEWNFEEDAFNKAIKGVKNQDVTDFYLGYLRIGHLSFDLKLMDYQNETGVVLDGDLYVGGVDTGYAYTLTNNLPYDFLNGIQVLNKKNIDKFDTLGEFKKFLINEAINFVNQNDNNIIVEKMNMNSLFDWS